MNGHQKVHIILVVKMYAQFLTKRISNLSLIWGILKSDVNKHNFQVCLSVSSMVIFTQLNSTKKRWWVRDLRRKMIFSCIRTKVFRSDPPPPQTIYFRRGVFSTSDFTGTRTLSGSYEEIWSERSQVSNVGSGFMKNGRWMSSWKFQCRCSPSSKLLPSRALLDVISERE